MRGHHPNARRQRVPPQKATCTCIISHPSLAMLTQESSGRPLPPPPPAPAAPGLQPQPFTLALAQQKSQLQLSLVLQWKEGRDPHSIPSPSSLQGSMSVCICGTRAAEGRWLSPPALCVVATLVTSLWTLRAAQPPPHPHSHSLITVCKTCPKPSN